MLPEILGIDSNRIIINESTLTDYIAGTPSSDYCIGLNNKFVKFDDNNFFCAE
jgi:hypothetical protein